MKPYPNHKSLTFDKEAQNNLPQEIKDKMRNDMQEARLFDYLSKEISEGKTEFRIAMQSKDEGIIHPLGKDGNTYDFKIIDKGTFLSSSK